MNGQAMGTRRRGSVKFAPYYKVQVWLARDMTWQDVQARYATPGEARDAYPAGERCRLMEVTMHGRAPLPET